MKRCPQCNRVETDDALGFCRVDGVPLVSESLPLNTDATEIETSLLPHSTNANVDRATGPTTVLPPPQSAPRPKRFGVVLMIVGVLLAASLLGAYFFSKKRNAPIQSIAVMPFVNAGSNPDVEYLSDGMTETLINTLAQLPDLTVKARSSVFRYKGKEVEPQTVGNELNVQAIVNGRVVQRDDDLTLYLSLVDTRTGNQLWGEQYTRKRHDLVSLQTVVGRDIATKLKTKLSGSDEQTVAKSYTHDAEAYQLYLQGRFFANKRTPQSILKAIEYYQQAIDKDPSYALGYAGLSDGYSLLAYYGGMPAPTALRKARAAAERAMSLDDNLAESHNAMGFVFAVADFDYPAAEREYKRAIALDPNFTTAHHNLGVMLTRTGRSEEGMAEVRRALEIEPFSIIVNRLYGECLIYLRRYDEGLAHLKKTSEMDPTFPTTFFALSGAYRLMGKHAESVESFAKFHELFGRPETAAVVRSSFATGGWQGFLREMTSKQRDGVSPYMTGIFLLELGEKEKAFVQFEKAFEIREYQLRFIKLDPSVDALRSDPRFKELTKRMRLD
ncbi:MAG TPA: tetratricopeptide repeat protein [Pyrinomonadaceae bacterium]|nr:tetratricopeptide repeat protein [Pyrinomonadaceae bacterium]